MNEFGWPATLKRTKGGVELSFPDWPDIVETGTTVQEAVIRARDALNRAVMLRIGEGTRVPLPSELQLGQLHVPIAEEVAVRLQAYLEERDKEYFREAAELQRAQHDLRAAFFTERRALLETTERRAEISEAGVREYASIGIRFCYILNAGGLIAVPAIMEILPDAAVAASKLLVPTITFVAGVLLAAATNFLAYYSMVKGTESLLHHAVADSKDLYGMYFPLEDQAAHGAEIAQERIDHERKLGTAGRLALWSRVAFCLAIGAFLFGVVAAISGVIVAFDDPGRGVGMRRSCEHGSPETNEDHAQHLQHRAGMAGTFVSSGMREYDQIWLKYEDQGLLDRLESLDDVNRLVLTFGEDVARTYRLITLRRNPSRDPTGYGLADAPIVGLLTRVAKLFRLICKFYELGNGDHLSVFSRPMIESAIVATYLLRQGDEAVEDFRRCSYKHTLRILRDHESGSEFFRTPAGKRVLRSALDDLALEGLSKESFAVQKRNRWRLQRKPLYKIFGEVIGPAEYPLAYGIMSESIHGSWNESMDWCLSRNDDNTFSAFALYHKVDARVILPLVRYATPPYILWTDRIQIQDDAMRQTFDRIHDYSHSIYHRFDELYDDPTADGSTSPDRT